MPPRRSAPEFVATLNVTVPLPVPFVGSEVRVIQALLFTTVHAQALLAVKENEPLVGFEAKLRLAGVSA